MEVGLLCRLGLAEADHTVTFLPFAALAEKFDPFEALENITLHLKAG
ncbi:MAG: hypothetical protein QNK21_21845 [Desulfosarcina sp.]|nr:hypothetical protein [Desulfosarcina sp.]MDX2455304.1 hypothetical protein [Desulfosarcina sp.]